MLAVVGPRLPPLTVVVEDLDGDFGINARHGLG
jgi:hypothetical protein